MSFAESDLKGIEKFLVVLYVIAHGRVVTSSRWITEVKQCRARLVLGWVTARCSVTHRPCVEVLGKPLISRCLCPPSSDGYLVERES